MNTKSNEITAIPKLLEKICIKGKVVTIDAMGTTTAIAEMVFEHFENGGDILTKFVQEKETVCDKYESSRVFRAGSEFLKR